MDPLHQHHSADDDDDIHTINTTSYRSRGTDHPSISIGNNSNSCSHRNGMMQVSSEIFCVTNDHRSHEIPAVFEPPPQSQQLLQRIVHHIGRNSITPTPTSSTDGPETAYHIPDVGRINYHAQYIGDDQSKTTMECGEESPISPNIDAGNGSLLVTLEVDEEALFV